MRISQKKTIIDYFTKKCYTLTKNSISGFCNLDYLTGCIKGAAKNLSGGNIMKIFKYVLMFILIASTMALAGCGGDKFAGKWYALNEDADSINMLDITKNGENYIVKRNTVSYVAEYKEVGKETVEREETEGFFNRNKVKRQYQVPVYEVTLNLKVKDQGQTTEVENKGRLGEHYTYIEKDGSLQGPGSMGKTITYKKGGEKDLIKKMQTTVAAFYDKAKSGEVKISVKGFGDWGYGKGGNIIKDYKFNEELPQELK